MRRLPVCALLLVVTGQIAVAGPRYPRTQPPVAAVTLSDRVKPVAAGAPAAVATPKPSVELAVVFAAGSPPVAARAEQEQILAQLIANTPDSEVEEKTDFYFRLAMLYANETRHWYAKAAERATAAAANPADTRSRTEANQSLDKAKQNLLKAVKTFKGLTDNEAFRNYPKMDTALFEYGYTLQAGKYLKEARQVYDKLLKNYPNSQHVPNAHVAFADYYYEAGQLADAETRYKQVLKFPKASVYWYAMYKLGWIHLQLQRNQEALEVFAQIVFASRGDTKKKFLHDAARRDFVYAYSFIGKYDRALEAFSRIDKDAAPDLVIALADDARARGKLEPALGAYRQLVSRAPRDPRACMWQYRIAHGTLSLPGASNVDKLREIETLVELHVRVRAEDTAKGVQEDTQCRDNAAAMAGELAAAYHNEWSKTRNAETLGYAERLYTAYVAGFPGSATQQAALAEVQWSHAELESNAKVRAERWERAANAFAAIGNFESDRAAALAWLNALDFVAPTDGKLAVGRKPATMPKPLPLKGRDIKAVAALTAYLAQAQQGTTQPTGEPPNADEAPMDNERAQARLALATTLRRYRQYDAAVDVLDEFLANHATHASAELAANLLLDSLVQFKSPDLAVVVTAMLADSAFVTGKPHLLRNLELVRQRR